MNKAPKPYYTLIETSIGDDPAVVVVNSALRTFRERDVFQWHLRISITCISMGANGMPTGEECEALNHLEDSIAALVMAGNNAVFLARITARGQRALLYRVRDPDVADTELKVLTTAPEQVREWSYEIQYDPSWELPQPELRLLERDSRFN